MDEKHEIEVTNMKRGYNDDLTNVTHWGGLYINFYMERLL